MDAGTDVDGGGAGGEEVGSEGSDVSRRAELS